MADIGETSDKKPLRLLDSRTAVGGLAYLTYKVVRPMDSGAAPYLNSVVANEKQT
jgi:hypothetical protein